MRSTRQKLIVVTLVIGFVSLWIAAPEGFRPAQAMPTFSQALGVSCQTCHTMVPALNSYGDYVQRTFYQAVNNKQTRATLPIWIWEEANGDSTGHLDSKQPGKKMTLGTLLLYFAGMAGPEFTYRFENSIWSGDQPTNQSSGPETAWIAWHGLFHGYGHLLVGNDYPGPVPSFLEAPAGDHETPYQIRHLFIGAHGYNLINTRLTARFDYEKGPINAQISWRGGSTSWISGGPSDFTGPGIDRAFQWLVADAPPSKPLSIGVFGIDGSYALQGKPGTSTGPPNVDYYNLYAPYFDVDPGWMKNAPGFYGFYASSHDSNPGIPDFTMLAPQGPNATDESFEAFEPFFKSHLMVSVRQETINNGLGEFTRYWATGFSAQPIEAVPYFFLRYMVVMDGYSDAPGGVPEYRWSVQYMGPISGPITSPFTRKSESQVAASSGAPVGASLYAANCEACHSANGQGMAGAFPALAGNGKVTASNPTALIIIIKHGSGAMPGYAMKLSNADIAAVLTYIRSTWGNNASNVTEQQVTAVK
jgi:cytochrome c6